MKRPIIIAIAFYFILAMAVLLIWPKYQDFSLIKKTIEIQKDEIEKTNDYFDKLKAADAELAANSEGISRIDSALPSESFPTDLFNFFDSMSSDNGLFLKEVKLGNSSNLSGNLSKIKATDSSVVVVGTYPAFKNFLSGIERSVRLISVENVSFSSVSLNSRETNTIVFTVGVKTYNFSE